MKVRYAPKSSVSKHPVCAAARDHNGQAIMVLTVGPLMANLIAFIQSFCDMLRVRTHSKEGLQA